MSLMVEMKCEKHPKYSAVLSPNTECLACWDVYEQRRVIERTLHSSDGNGNYCLLVNGVKK